MIDPDKTLRDYECHEEDDGYESPDGCWWSCAKDMLVSSDDFCGMCGCGSDTDFDYILVGLRFIAEKFSGSHDEHHVWFKARQEREVAHFGNAAAAQFFYKWADQRKFAEHGSSVPGWLAESGKALLRLMEEAEKIEPKEPE